MLLLLLQAFSQLLKQNSNKDLLITDYVPRNVLELKTIVFVLKCLQFKEIGSTIEHDKYLGATQTHTSGRGGIYFLLSDQRKYCELNDF